MPGPKPISQVLVATGNPGKLRELRDLLTPLGVQVLDPSHAGGLDPVEEDGDTLEANARKKALAALGQTGIPALADDSGLFVEALDGAPGVLSARYAGPDQNAAANRAKILAALGGVDDRRASFACVLALAVPGGEVHLFRGACAGTIAEGEHGTGGFGYDSIFVPQGRSRTFAEMAPGDKNAISHRGRALEQLKAFFQKESLTIDP